MRVTIQFWLAGTPTSLEEANAVANSNDADYFLYNVGIYRVGTSPKMVTHRDNLPVFMEDVVSGRKS